MKLALNVMLSLLFITVTTLCGLAFIMSRMGVALVRWLVRKVTGFFP